MLLPADLSLVLLVQVQHRQSTVLMHSTFLTMARSQSSCPYLASRGNYQGFE